MRRSAREGQNEQEVGKNLCDEREDVNEIQWGQEAEAASAEGSGKKVRLVQEIAYHGI